MAKYRDSPPSYDESVTSSPTPAPKGTYNLVRTSTLPHENIVDGAQASSSSSPGPNGAATMPMPTAQPSSYVPPAAAAHRTAEAPSTTTTTPLDASPHPNAKLGSQNPYSKGGPPGYHPTGTMNPMSAGGPSLPPSGTGAGIPLYHYQNPHTGHTFSSPLPPDHPSMQCVQTGRHVPSATHWGILGILSAIVFFPWGIACCLLDRQVECKRCGELLHQGCST